MTTPAPASDAPSAHYPPYGTQDASYGDLTTYGGYDANGFSADGHGTADFQADPLHGGYPGGATGGYDSSSWSTDGSGTPYPDTYATHYAACDTGAYDATAWAADQHHLSSLPQQATAADLSGRWDSSGQWDASPWLQPQDPSTADPTQQWDWGTQSYETGTYDATQWNGEGGTPEPYAQQPDPGQPGAEAQEAWSETGAPQSTAVFEQPVDEHAAGEDGPSATGELPAVDMPSAASPADGPDGPAESAAVRPPRAASRGTRSRRRAPAKRSALLTIAVPSVCVMGVAGIAAASVGTFDGDGRDATASAPDPGSVKQSPANSKLDTQLAKLSAGADDFVDRASRTQERIDLKAEQEAERKKAAEEAARKERLRPKFALPVAQRGLSAYYGQAGVNWMSVHTGIDFPVSYGTTVMAATDGVVSTKWNSAYGNMMIVTAKDGTQTWYCHLSRYRVAPGTTVKAGQPIAYSGNSGNTTGPHLHFEVRPNGGSTIDPLPWLRSHDLDPT
ncbi:peptidoglycan DD-metalloendopeptidase family protein [Streptomyces sp. MS06]